MNGATIRSITTRQLALVCSVPLILALAGCSSAPPPPEVEFRLPVTVRDVGVDTVEDRVVATGTLRSAETIRIRTESPGLLIFGKGANGRRLAEGDRIKAGQLLAEVTGDDVRFAARSEATKQAYDVALRDYEQKQQLYEEGLLSEAEFLPVESRLADAKLEWERSQFTESRSKMVSPIDGVSLSLARGEDGTPMADGQRVEQGFEIAQIAPKGALIADVDLVGGDVARVRPGQEARVRYFAWDEKRFEGRVLRLAPSVDPQTRTLRAEVAVRNPESILRPGMFVEVTMIAERRNDVPVVPRQAVTERGGRKVVFVLNGQQVKRKDVVLGLGDDRIIEIRSGIEAGDRVVVRGLETLTDEQKVRVTGS